MFFISQEEIFLVYAYLIYEAWKKWHYVKKNLKKKNWNLMNVLYFELLL